MARDGRGGRRAPRGPDAGARAQHRRGRAHARVLREHTYARRQSRWSGSWPATRWRHEDRLPRPLDHFVVGQRPRDELPRARRGSRCARPRCAVPRARRPLVRGPAATCRPRRAGGRSSTSRSTSSHAGSRESSPAPTSSSSARTCRAGWQSPNGRSRSPAERSRFYDIDTPVTLEKLAAGDEEYLSRALVPRFDLYLSFTGGPLLARIEDEYGAAARPAVLLHGRSRGCTGRSRGRRSGCSATWAPTAPTASRRSRRSCWSPPARRARARFVVAGPQYPPETAWPGNVQRFEHLPPAAHPDFYARQRFTLNVTRAGMVEAGYSPSVRLFEAAACGVPDHQRRLGGARRLLRSRPRRSSSPTGPPTSSISSTGLAERARAIGAAARARVVADHSPERRAQELEEHVRALALVAP